MVLILLSGDNRVEGVCKCARWVLANVGKEEGYGGNVAVNEKSRSVCCRNGHGSVFRATLAGFDRMAGSIKSDTSPTRRSGRGKPGLTVNGRQPPLSFIPWS